MVSGGPGGQSKFTSMVSNFPNLVFTSKKVKVFFVFLFNLKFLGGLRGGDWPDKVYELGPKHLFSNHETTWSWISPGLFCFWFQNMYNPTFLGGLEGAGWPVKVYERGLQHPQLCFHFTKGKSVFRFSAFQLNQKHRAAVCYPSQSFRNKYNLKFLGGLRGDDWPVKA